MSVRSPGSNARAIYGSGSSTNDSSIAPTVDFVHTPNLLIPASLLNVAGRKLLVTIPFKVTGGSAAPSFTPKLFLGASPVYVGTGATAAPSTLTARLLLEYLIRVLSAGVAGQVECYPLVQVSAAGSGVNSNQTAAATIDTTTAQSVNFVSNWSATGTGTSTIVVSDPFVQVVN